MKKLEDAIGQECDFFGVDNNVFCLGFLGSPKRSFEAVVNFQGHSSSLLDVEEVSLDGHVFLQQSAAKVRVEKVDVAESFYGYQLVDKETHHVWLRFGTALNDCYPCFVFKYLPDLSKVQKNE